MFAAVLMTLFSIANWRLPIYLKLRGHANRKSQIYNPKSLEAVRLIPSQGKIFSKCVSLPVFRQKYPAQIGVSVKNYAKQVIRLALVPIRRAPHTGDGGDVKVLLV
jgi:hypothetical protein